MEKIIDDVRRDAIAKLKKATNTKNKLLESAEQIIMLAETARQRGLLALEEIVENIESDYAKQLITFMIDGTDPVIIAEIATNKYWTDAPEDAQAMIYYIYLRGILGIQSGEHPKLLEKILLSLIPIEVCEEYKAWADEREKKSQIRYENAIREKQSHIRYENAITEKFSNISTQFSSENTLKSISDLENQLQMYPNPSIQRIARDIDNRTWAVCVYALKGEKHCKMQSKLLDNISKRTKNIIMEDVVFNPPINETEICDSIAKMLSIIHQLQKSGEICKVY